LNRRLFVRLDEDPLQGPESGTPLPTLRAFALHAALRPWALNALVYRETFAPGHEVIEHVLPDGALRLVAHLGDDDVVLQLIGPSAAAVQVRLGGRMRGLSITLKPGAALALFGLPAGALLSTAVNLRALWGDDADALASDILDAPDDSAMVQVVQRALLARLERLSRRPDPGHTLVAHAQGRLALPGTRVADLVRTLGVGERRLQQLFHEQVGLSPRVWTRLARLHRGLRMLRREPALPWAQLAAEAGYSDQAHLSHDFRALCGITPSEFRRMAASGSYKTAS